MTKPFFRARVDGTCRALLRRSQPKADAQNELKFGPAEIDFRSYEAKRDGISIEMTRKEFAILRYLSSHAGQVVTRDDLLNESVGYESYPTSRTRWTITVAGLRAKLERDSSQPEHIKTVHGVGYKFVPRADGFVTNMCLPIATFDAHSRRVEGEERFL